MKSIIIEADYRERRSGIIEALQLRDGVIVNEVYLKAGDYKINNYWLVERKSLVDLAASIIDGRLFQQLALDAPAYRKLLLIEGTTSALARSNIKREAIQGALVTIALYFGIPILRSRNQNETASLLITIGRQMYSFKGVFDSTGTPLRPLRSKYPYRQKLIMLQCLPGIGVTKARALLQKFGSIEKVLLSTVKELAETKGIGMKTAEKIRQMVNHSHAEPKGFASVGTRA